jgi:hypothetical protein
MLAVKVWRFGHGLKFKNPSCFIIVFGINESVMTPEFP